VKNGCNAPEKNGGVMAAEESTDIKGKAVNFFQALFDFSFRDFITSKLIKSLFAFGVVVGGIFSAINIITSFGKSIGAGFLMLVLTPIVYLLGVIVLRIWLEFVMIIFKIEENTR
jgi:hypothetical protein